MMMMALVCFASSVFRLDTSSPTGTSITTAFFVSKSIAVIESLIPSNMSTSAFSLGSKRGLKGSLDLVSLLGGPLPVGLLESEYLEFVLGPLLSLESLLGGPRVGGFLATGPLPGGLLAG